MNYLVDASVAVKWFIEEENLHTEALNFLNIHGGNIEAPDIIVSETANVAWKKCLRGEISEEQAQYILFELRDYLALFHFSAGLTERALDIALELKHPVYDCIYLACAEMTDRALITADKRLEHQLTNTPFADRVVPLDQFSP